jgi:hypothetical protein
MREIFHFERACHFHVLRLVLHTVALLFCGEFFVCQRASLCFPVRNQFNPDQSMKNHFKSIAGAALALTSIVSVCVAQESVVGKWKGDIDSQIGIQKYTYDFKLDGTNVTGKAYSETQMGTNDVALADIKINQDEITFTEPMKFQDNAVSIAYTGKINGDEIKFHRKVGDFAEEDFVAKRVTDAGTNSPPAQP